MGKVDDMRALREARFSQKTATPATKAKVAKKVLAAAVAPKEAPEELCGHRSISNKSCTREKGHQEAGTKNHRYS